MAKNSITDYSKTAASNTDIQSVDIDEGCLPSGINNAIRELMADLADMNDGTVSLTSPSFVAATITGDLTVDTDTLYVDSANNRVGIGTSSPSATLHVSGNIIADNTAGGSIQIKKSGTNSAFVGEVEVGLGSGDGLLLYTYTGTDRPIIAYTNGTERMRIDSSGRVGIGVTPFSAGGNGDALMIGDPTSDTGSGLSILSTTTGDIQFGDANTGTGRYAGLVRYDHSNNSMDFWTNSTEKMTIDSSGNVGIGTSSPVSTLDSRGDIRIYNNATDVLIFGSALYQTIGGSSGSNDINYRTYANHIFKTGTGASSKTDGTERMRIDSSGNVTLGAGGTYRLDINAPTSSAAKITCDNTPMEIGTFDSHPLKILVGNTERMSIETNGRVRVGSTSTSNNGAFEVNNISYYLYPIYKLSSETYNPRFAVFQRADRTEVGSIRFTTSPYVGVTYNTTSDYRLKENVVGITDGITRVKQLNPSRFNFISEPDDTKVDGFLAHEVATVVPEAITGQHNETQAVGNITNAEGDVVASDVQEPPELEEGQTWTETGTEPVYQQIDQSKLIPLLTAALQEAIAKIEDLEARVATLEGN